MTVAQHSSAAAVADASRFDAGDGSISRRTFVRAALGGAVGAALLSINGRQRFLGDLGLPAVPVKSTGLAALANHVGEVFQVRDGALEIVELQLVEAVDLAPRYANKGVTMLSLLFRGLSDQTLPQKTYRFEHGELGGFELFIVPTGPLKSEAHYEAVIHYL